MDNRGESIGGLEAELVCNGAIGKRSRMRANKVRCCRVKEKTRDMIGDKKRLDIRAARVSSTYGGGRCRAGAQTAPAWKVKKLEQPIRELAKSRRGEETIRN